MSRSPLHDTLMDFVGKLKDANVKLIVNPLNNACIFCSHVLSAKETRCDKCGADVEDVLSFENMKTVEVPALASDIRERVEASF